MTGRSLHPIAVVLLGLAAAPLRSQIQGEQQVIVEGRVVDLLGEPVPAAAVRVVADGRTRGVTSTDAQGVYRVRTRLRREGELCIGAPGKVEQRLACAPQAGEQLVNVVLEDGARLAGRVTGERGAGIAGASVVCVAGAFSAQCTSDRSGAFEFAAVPLRTATVRVWTGNGIAERTVRVAGNARCDVEVRGSQSGERRVRIVGLPPQGIAEARVEILSFDQALQRDGGLVQLHADGTSTFVATDTCLVRAVVPGFEVLPKGIMIARGAGSGEALEFRLAPAVATVGTTLSVVKGHVRDDKDRPVGGVRLVVEDVSNVRLGSCTVQNDGSFRVPIAVGPKGQVRIGLELGAWQLQASQPCRTRGHSWTALIGDLENGIELAVERASCLVAEPRTANGERLPYATVGIFAKRDARRCLLTLTADRNGWCEVRGLAPDDYRFVAAGMDGSIVVADIAVGGGDRRSVSGWQQLPSGALEGRVVDPDGNPVPGVELYLASPALREADPDLNGPLDAKVTTDGLGRFRCRVCTPGDWTVVATGDATVEGGRGEVLAGKPTFVELRCSTSMPAASAGEGLAAPPANGR